MGRAIMALIERELVGVFGESAGDEIPVFAGRAEEQLAAREAQVAARESEAKAAEKRLGGWGERLRLWEGELVAWEQRTELASKLVSRPTVPNRKVGRNDQCPCGSGRKYKRCHGAPEG